jgi:outer membrane immunogenic protein
MKKSTSILSAVMAASATLWIGVASAADMAVKAPVAPIPPPCTWCGFYVGLNAGASWSKNDDVYTATVGGTSITAVARPEKTSFIGGGQVGYNWQWGQFVLGIESDLAFRQHTDGANLVPFPAVPSDQVNITNSQNWLVTVRPRAGVAFGNVLLYGTGGLAFGEVEHSYQEIRVTTGQARMLADSSDKTGWAAGVGVQWAFAPNWSVGAEYLHVDLGSTTLAQGPSTVAGLAFPASQTIFANKSDMIRAKLDFQFSLAPPVVAKY